MKLFTATITLLLLTVTVPSVVVVLGAGTWAVDTIHTTNSVLTTEEAKALDDTTAADSRVVTQLNNLLQQASQLAVEPTVSMQFHSQVKDLMSQRVIISERLRALKAEHRLAHNCPTCEYKGHNLVPKGEVK